MNDNIRLILRLRTANTHVLSTARLAADEKVAEVVKAAAAVSWEDTVGPREVERDADNEKQTATA